MKGTRFSLSAEILFEIEEALLDPPFFGISIGPTLTDVLTTELYNGNHVWNYKNYITDHMRYQYYRYRQPRKSKNVSNDFTLYKNRILFTWLFERFDLKRMVFPLLAAYSAAEVLVLGTSASMEAQLPGQTAYVNWSDFPEIDMNAWRTEYDRCSSAWKQRLKNVLKKHAIHGHVLIYILAELAIQTQLVMASSLFLDIVEPSVIITEYDRNKHASCLLLAAKNRNIPTITMIHGVFPTYPAYGVAPLIADIALCWGELHKAQMMEYGVSPGRLIITGCHRLSNMIEADIAASRAKANLPIDKPVVLLATNPIRPVDKLHLAYVFCEAMATLDCITAVVRLHPAERLIEYQELIDRFPAVRFMPNHSWTQDEALAAADIVVNHDSGFGNDALVKSKIVVELDALSSPLEYGKELVDLAGCPSVKNTEELAGVIKLILADKRLQEELIIKSAKYVHSYCSAFGQEATDNIVCEIERLIAVGS